MKKEDLKDELKFHTERMKESYAKDDECKNILKENIEQYSKLITSCEKLAEFIKMQLSVNFRDEGYEKAIDICQKIENAYKRGIINMAEKYKIDPGTVGNVMFICGLEVNQQSLEQSLKIFKEIIENEN